MKGFWRLFVKKIANSLDLGDFSQIILYFKLSTWTHIEYRIKSSTVAYTFFVFCSIGFIICIPFFNTKNQLFIEQFCLKFVRCTIHLWSIFLSRNHEYLHNSTVDYSSYFSLTSFAHFDILLMHKTYRPSIFSILLQLKWKYENIQRKSKLLAKVIYVNTKKIYRK